MDFEGYNVIAPTPLILHVFGRIQKSTFCISYFLFFQTCASWKSPGTEEVQRSTKKKMDGQ